MNAEQPISFGKILYSIWLVLGAVGFPVSFGWLIYRLQKLAKATTDKERIDRRAQFRKAGIIAFAFLLVLVGFIVYNLLFADDLTAA